MPGLGSSRVVVVDDTKRPNLGGGLFQVVEAHDQVPGAPVSSRTDPAPDVSQVDP